MLADVFHFSFTVKDLDASIRWYRDVLGLELVHRQRGDNEYTRKLVGFPDAVIEVAQFRVAGVVPRLSTHMLELVQYVSPEGGREAPPINFVGAAHLAFVVDDARGEYERLRAHGVEFRNPPVHITEGANAGGYACYLSDPDGITLELLQRPSRGQSF